MIIVFKGKQMFNYKILFLVTNDLCFNFQKCKEELKKITFSKKVMFSGASVKF